MHFWPTKGLTPSVMAEPRNQAWSISLPATRNSQHYRVKNNASRTPEVTRDGKRNTPRPEVLAGGKPEEGIHPGILLPVRRANTVRQEAGRLPAPFCGLPGAKRGSHQETVPPPRAHRFIRILVESNSPSPSAWPVSLSPLSTLRVSPHEKSSNFQNA